MVGNVSGLNSMNDDFMYQQYMKSLQTQGYQQTQQTQQTQNQNATSFQRQGVDTFEKKGTNGKGIIVSILGAGGAGYAGYINANPMQNGLDLFKESLLKDANYAIHSSEELNEATKLITNAEAKAIETAKPGTTWAQYKAAERLVDVGDINKLSDVEKTALGSIKDVDEAKQLINDIKPELSKINTEKLIEEAAKNVENGSIANMETKLANNKSAKALLEKLPATHTTDDLTKLIKENPKTFGIVATEEAAIASEASTIAAKGKASLLTEYGANITNAENTIKTLKTEANATLMQHWDKTTNTFKKDAPEALTKGLKNFKWKTAGKWGAIAAGVGLVLNWAFGGKKA